MFFIGIGIFILAMGLLLVFTIVSVLRFIASIVTGG